MKVVFVVCCIICTTFHAVGEVATSMATSMAGQLVGSVMKPDDSGSFIDSIKNFFSPGNFNLKKITVYSFDDSNQGAPVKIHLVVVFNSQYENEAKSSLDILTANEYGEQAEQLKKRFPDTLVGVSWEIIAKKGVHPLTLEQNGKSLLDCGHMIATKAYIFVQNYSKCDKLQPQVAVLANTEEIGILLDKDTFHVNTNDRIKQMIAERMPKEAKDAKAPA